MYGACGRAWGVPPQTAQIAPGRSKFGLRPTRQQRTVLLGMPVRLAISQSLRPARTSSRTVATSSGVRTSANLPLTSPSGEIFGKLSALKRRRPKGLAGSSPASGTYLDRRNLPAHERVFGPHRGSVDEAVALVRPRRVVSRLGPERQAVSSPRPPAGRGGTRGRGGTSPGSRPTRSRSGRRRRGRTPARRCSRPAPPAARRLAAAWAAGPR
jgi:hypothetical protein